MDSCSVQGAAAVLASHPFSSEVENKLACMQRDIVVIQAEFKNEKHDIANAKITGGL